MAGETEIHLSAPFLLLSYLKQYLKSERECLIVASKHRETDESTTPKQGCYIRYPNTEKWFEKNEAQWSVFLPTFECLISLPEALIILVEIQGKSSQNFMTIKVKPPSQ